jgi:thiamine transporter ThiT
MINWFYFLLTLLIELPVVLIFFRKQMKHALIAGFLLNLFTWPLLHVILYTSSLSVYFLEFCVAITESIGYRLMMNCSWKKAILLGFLANIASYGTGLLINNFL